MIFDVSFLLRVGASVLLAAVLSFSMTPPVKHLAERVGAIDVPKDGRRMHKTPIPRMGGLAIFIGFLVAALIFMPRMDRALWAILIGAALIVVLGMLDDRFTLPAKSKLVVQLAAAAILVFFGDLRIDRLTNPFGPSLYSYWDLGFWAYPITIIWILAITNAVNFIDGLDGLACGVSGISSINLMIIALLVSNGQAAILMAALTGACIGFLPHNFNPAKIFMGDTGSTFLGFMLAAVSVQGLFKAYTVISFLVPVLLLGLPIFDICFAVIRRIANGKSPMEADRGHIHHRLIDMGFSQKQSVAIAYVLTGILGLAAVLLTVSGAVRTMIMLSVILVVGAVGLHFILRTRPCHAALHSVEQDAAPEEKGEPPENGECGQDPQPSGADETDVRD